MDGIKTDVGCKTMPFTNAGGRMKIPAPLLMIVMILVAPIRVATSKIERSVGGSAACLFSFPMGLELGVGREFGNLSIPAFLLGHLHQGLQFLALEW